MFMEAEPKLRAAMDLGFGYDFDGGIANNPDLKFFSMGETLNHYFYCYTIEYNELLQTDVGLFLESLVWYFEHTINPNYDSVVDGAIPLE